MLFRSTLNVASLAAAKLMATRSPDQYPLGLLYINPKRTANPKESENLKAGMTLLLLRPQLFQTSLKENPFCFDEMGDDPPLFFCTGFLAVAFGNDLL